MIIQTLFRNSNQIFGQILDNMNRLEILTHNQFVYIPSQIPIDNLLSLQTMKYLPLLKYSDFQSSDRFHPSSSSTP